jgi:tripartite-type tricarboxylate transporter receptor subunit TctC
MPHPSRATLTPAAFSPNVVGMREQSEERRMKASNKIRRFGLHAALAIGCLALSAAEPVSAQDWPSRNITVVVPLGAGSASDIIARVVMEQLGKQLGRTIVVENRPGAGGTIGAGSVAKAAPDGTTLLVYGAMSIANALYSKLPYDTLNDFVPVTALGQQPLVIITAPSKGYKTLRDLVAAAKAKPGELNYSSAGVGTASHFAAERLSVSAGIKAQHIPFRGAAEAVTELVAGRVDFSPQIFTTTLPLIRDGKLMPLAVSAHKRTAIMPEVPTTIEAGLSNDSVYPFYTALYAPAKTPREIIDRLHRETTLALQAPAVKERFATLGVEPLPMSLEQFDKFFREDVVATAALVKAANIPVQ